MGQPLPKQQTWRQKGAPGCSKCRFRGCRTCFEKGGGSRKEEEEEQQEHHHHDEASANHRPAAAAVTPEITAEDEPAMTSTSVSRVVPKNLDNIFGDCQSKRTVSAITNHCTLNERQLESSHGVLMTGKGDDMTHAGDRPTGVLEDSQRIEKATKSRKRPFPRDGRTRSSQPPRDDDCYKSMFESSSSDDDDSLFEDGDEEVVAVRTKPKRQTKEKPSKELSASVEIDRLLQEANDDYALYFPCASAVKSRESSLRDIETHKKELGCVNYLRLLREKLCLDCNQRLSMFFTRKGCGNKVMSRACAGLCCHCFTDDFAFENKWTASQAEQAMQVSLANLRLDPNVMRYLSPVSSNGHAGMPFYSADMVTRASLIAHGNVFSFYATLVQRSRSR